MPRNDGKRMNEMEESPLPPVGRKRQSSSQRRSQQTNDGTALNWTWMWMLDLCLLGFRETTYLGWLWRTSSWLTAACSGDNVR